MARFVLCDSIPSKILALAACALASLYFQLPVATAQRVAGAGGVHPISGAHIAPPSRVAVPPAPRPLIFQRRIITSPRPTALSARFGLRPGPNNLFRRSLFFGPRFFGFGPAFAFNSIWWQNCNAYSSWGYYCNGLPFYGYGYGFENYVTLQPYQAPVYVYAAPERPLVWLYLKDGSAYSVSDYWFVNGQVHFIAVEQGGAKSVEQTIPFDSLDVQKTVDVNVRRGFRVVMRDEPLERYLHDHPDLSPPSLESPPTN